MKSTGHLRHSCKRLPQWKSDEAVPTAAAAHVVAEPTKPAEKNNYHHHHHQHDYTKVDPFSKLTACLKESSAHETILTHEPFDGHVTHTARALK
uniref:Uncharacterized protein n=1 Tax=Ditylenchus dipsaci TaxID=166011 RepID=A0A915D333_9BILA